MENHLRISPTDLSQYVRLGRCERFLAIRLRERHGVNVFAEYNVAPHPVSPLLKTVGEAFETEVVRCLTRHCLTVHCGDATDDGRPRGADNQRIAETARQLSPGGVVVLVQPAVAALLGTGIQRIEVFGNIDLLRLGRIGNGDLQVLIVDVKRSAEARLDHHLQAALYALIVEDVLRNAGMLPCIELSTGILRARRNPGEQETGAESLFGCGAIAVFEMAPDPDAPVESFFGTLKQELVHRHNFATREGARQEIFNDIEVWYNRKRRHSSLGYLSPADFEEKTLRGTISQPILTQPTVHKKRERSVDTFRIGRVSLASY